MDFQLTEQTIVRAFNSKVTIVHHKQGHQVANGIVQPDSNEKTAFISQSGTDLGPCDPEICENDCDGLDHEFHPHFKTGLTWPRAVMFLVGEVLGAGVVAVSDAMANVGLAAILLMIIGCFGNCFVAFVQSENLLMIGRINPAYRRHLRDPYTTIVEVALGKKAKKTAAVLLHILSISVITVYLLVSADLLVLFIRQFTTVLSNDGSFRIWIAIFVVFLIPLTWFGTPHEFWGVALVAIVTTLVAAVAFVIKLWLDAPSNLSAVPKRQVTADTFFFGLGTLFFAFAGAPFFPTIQSDMKKRSEFTKSAVVGYIIILITYIPVAVSGYVTLGAKVNPNIIFNVVHPGLAEAGSIQMHWHKAFGYVALLSLGVHFVFGYILIFNPMAQELEEALKIPRAFCWQRCVIRSSLVLITLILGEAVPDFSIFLSLIGGTLLSILTYTFPILAYLKLKKDVPMWRKVTLMILFGMCCISVAGVIYSSIKAIVNLYS